MLINFTSDVYIAFDCYNYIMRRLLVVVSFFLIACQAVSSAAPVLLATSPASPPATPTITAEPTFTSQPTAVRAAPAPGEFIVQLHPDGPLFIGDRVSFEVISTEEIELEESNVAIRVEGHALDELSTAEFGGFGIGGRMQATFSWVWDTSELQAGEYQVEFSVQPDDLTWTETVHLLPAEHVPDPEPHARWSMANIQCCTVNYITGTRAARDLEVVLDLAEMQSENAIRRMGIDFGEPIPITIVPRVVGHGGFASNEIYISYLDENYAGNDLAQVLHHEMIHILDRRLGGELRPSLLVEGLAVYLSNGHFKKEPLLSRAAVLLDLGWYLPLNQLADAFYTSQHEIGYLEGAALVQYMVERFGWEAFNDFYRDIHPHPSEKQSSAIDVSLRDHFGLSLEQLEVDFKGRLRRQHIIPDMVDDVRLTITYYDTVRRYQQLLDPSAFFLTAWLPDGEQMREREIVADFLRRPSTEENLDIENLLVKVDRDLRAGNYTQGQKTIHQINRRLDLLEEQIVLRAD